MRHELTLHGFWLLLSRHFPKHLRRQFASSTSCQRFRLRIVRRAMTKHEDPSLLVILIVLCGHRQSIFQASATARGLQLVGNTGAQEPSRSPLDCLPWGACAAARACVRRGALTARGRSVKATQSLAESFDQDTGTSWARKVCAAAQGPQSWPRSTLDSTASHQLWLCIGARLQARLLCDKADDDQHPEGVEEDLAGRSCSAPLNALDILQLDVVHEHTSNKVPVGRCGAA